MSWILDRFSPVSVVFRDDTFRFWIAVLRENREEIRVFGVIDLNNGREYRWVDHQFVGGEIERLSNLPSNMGFSAHCGIKVKRTDPLTDEEIQEFSKLMDVIISKSRIRLPRWTKELWNKALEKFTDTIPANVL